MSHFKMREVVVPFLGNNNDLHFTVESGNDSAVRFLLDNYSLPLFMLGNIAKRKDLSKKTRDMAKKERLIRTAQQREE